MKKQQLLFIAALLCLNSMATEVFRCTFTPPELKSWTLPPGASIEKKDGQFAMKFTANSDSTVLAEHPFDMKPYAGKILRITYRMKARRIETAFRQDPEMRQSGLKVSIRCNLKNGELRDIHPYRPLKGTAEEEWISVSHGAFPEKDMDSGGMLRIGMEDVRGVGWITDLRISAFELNEIYPPIFADENFRCEYTSRVTGDVRRRGAMFASKIIPGVTIEKNLPALRSLGANLLRYQLIRNWGKVMSDRDAAEFSNWVHSRIPEIRQMLDSAHEKGMKVVLDLHVPPGGRRALGDMNMFHEKKYFDAFVEIWRKLAAGVKGHPALYGYDLINEPTCNPGAKYDYLHVQYTAAKAVREIDPDTPIIIESNFWCNPKDYVYMHPLPLKNIIYQIHAYPPYLYTHTGVHGNPLAKVSYPGVFDFGERLFLDRPDNFGKWDKERLRNVFSAVRDFELKYGAKIYVGEFSAVRWASGREAWFRDLIEIFEEYKWDWTYHAFREWSGWSIEHSDNKNETEPTSTPTKAKQVFLKAFEQNEFPRPAPIPPPKNVIPTDKLI